jgi:hypothetical protein
MVRMLNRLIFAMDIRVDKSAVNLPDFSVLVHLHIPELNTIVAQVLCFFPTNFYQVPQQVQGL